MYKILNQKKIYLSIFLIFICSVGNAQISGKVKNEKGEILVFATIFNSTRNTSSITDINGYFRIDAIPGDSITVRYLGHKTTNFKIKANDDVYVLNEEGFQLDEITINPFSKLNLLRKCLENTFTKLNKESLSKVAYNYVLLINYDTVHTVNLDLNVIHKKKKTLKKGEIFKSYIAGEKITVDTVTPINLFASDYIGRPINMIINPTHLRSITQTEDSSKIIIHLFFKRYNDNIEILINKDDSCVYESTRKAVCPYEYKKTGKIISRNEGYYEHEKFNQKNGIYYLDEYLKVSSFQHLDNNKTYNFSTHYKTNQIFLDKKEFEEIKKGRFIPGNLFRAMKFRKTK